VSEFDDLIDELLGDDDATTDVRVVVRRLWFYDFQDAPLRVWDGKGKLFTSDGNEWIGTIDANNRNVHTTPSVQDGRDGTSATYNMSLLLPDRPGYPVGNLYEQLKTEQWRVAGRSLTIYLAVFDVGEALRPQTPIAFFKEMTMLSTKFSEILEPGEDGRPVRKYKTSILAKDGNSGRANVPNGTYADTCQKQRAAELGVTVDKGCEYVASLASRTMQIP